ncbi:MAG: ComEA family DNA-binding protein [Eubacteriales bacterium]|nr:ComEA family DNA-binding protein [Eubacteriales bacterium]
MVKKLYTYLLAGAVLLACSVICFSLENVEKGENIIVQREYDTAPPEGALLSAEGYIELLPGETVNINTADAARLALLPGIGEELSGRIIAYREENGCFEEIEDIMKVDGIGEGRMEKIRPLIVTGEEK